jgi:hypothetical protein
LQFDVVADFIGSWIALSRIGAQIWIFHYMLEDFDLGLDALRSVVRKLKDGPMRTMVLINLILNQIGLTLVELCGIK